NTYSCPWATRVSLSACRKAISLASEKSVGCRTRQPGSFTASADIQHQLSPDVRAIGFYVACGEIPIQHISLSSSRGLSHRYRTRPSSTLRAGASSERPSMWVRRSTTAKQLSFGEYRQASPRDVRL